MAAPVGALISMEVDKKLQWAPPSSWQHVPSPEQANFALDDLPRYADSKHEDPEIRSPAKILSTPASNNRRSFSSEFRGVEFITTTNDLESSRPASPESVDVTEMKQSWNSPHMNKWRILTACLINFAGGANDSAPGALLPYIERYYHINYATVAMIFVTNAIGFITASCIVQLLDSKLGRAKTCLLCEMVVAAGYVMMIVTPPYPAFAIAYFVTGLGMATTLALNNVFCANLNQSTIILGFFHGSYGIGGVMAPIIATTMVTHGILFSRFFSVLLGLRFINFCMVAFSFWHFERDQGIEINQKLLKRTASGRKGPGSKTVRLKEYFNALKNRTTLIGAFFIFAYQGAEVSISGWVISFLITVRKGDPAHVGYVTSGFWGGITLGRFALSPFGHRFGEKKMVMVVLVLTIVFQVITWQVPNVIGDAISVALIGLLLGPIYPCATTVFSRLLPRTSQNTAIAFISSAGSSGGAIFPFVTGLIAKSSGTWVMHPICISCYVLMIGCWLGLPRITKRRE